MAQTVKIEKKNDIVKIIVDGNEIQDVVSFKLCEEVNSVPTLSLTVAIIGAIEAQRIQRDKPTERRLSMTKLFCPYCGELLSDGCTCEQDDADYAEQQTEELEERQHQSGFYAFQDMMEMRRMER